MRGVLLAAALAFASTPAHATQDIVCRSPDGAASATLGVGTLPVLSIISASIVFGEEKFTTWGEGDARIAVGQAAYLDGGGLSADFVDANISEIRFSLRLVSASDGRDQVMAGVLRRHGQAVAPVICEG